MPAWNAEPGAGCKGGRRPPPAPAGAWLLVWALGLLLAGCETLPPVLGGSPRGALAAPEARRAAWEGRRTRLRALPGWEIRGRLGLESGDEVWSVSVRWIEKDGRYRIRLSGPFGQGAVEIRGGEGEVVLTDGRSRRVAARSPQALMEAELGWSVPVEGLRYWLRGILEPGAPDPPDLVLDSLGRPVSFTRAGWRVRYSSWESEDPLALPRKMELVRDDLPGEARPRSDGGGTGGGPVGAAGGAGGSPGKSRLRARIVVREWLLPPGWEPGSTPGSASGARRPAGRGGHRG